jgi:hypothetical protein
MPDIKHPKCDHPKCSGSTKGIILFSYYVVGYVLIVDCSKKTISNIQTIPLFNYQPIKREYDDFPLCGYRSTPHYPIDQIQT